MSFFEKKLKRLISSFVLLQIFLFTLVLSFFVLIADFLHNATADITAKQFRHFYLLNDQRMATQILHASNSKFVRFERIQFKDTHNKIVINYPTEIDLDDTLERFLVNKINIPIYFDVADSEPVGFLNFYYNILKYLPVWIFSYLFLGALSFVFLLKEKKKILSQMSKEQEIDKSLALNKLALQVAHDIRSPVSVIKGLKDEINILPDDVRLRLESSISRVEEIAHHLLRTYKRTSEEIKTNNKSIHLLSLLKAAVDDKKIELRNKSNISINFTYDPVTFYAFSYCSDFLMRSIVSNLINNAVDAIELTGNGVVEIKLYESKWFNEIMIIDSGAGVSAKDEVNLFKEGFSTKPHGNGLGLYNAKVYIQSCGGDLTYSRDDNKTIFKILLPKRTPHENFPYILNAFSNKKMIFLDDDESVLKKWGGIFKEASLFYSDLLAFEKEFPGKLSPEYFLISDYKFLNSSKNGLEIICEKDAVRNALLVTALSNDPDLEFQCANKGVRLLNKDLINFLPILLKAPNVILIDNDKFIRTSWASFCLKNNYPFYSFNSVHDFLNSNIDDLESFIFVDSSLDHGVKGELEAERIYDKGFRKIFLVTGYEDIPLERYPWFLGMFTKSPEVLNQIFS